MLSSRFIAYGVGMFIIAHWYDLMEALPEFLGVKSLRHEILQRESGKVLDVAAGTGKNLRGTANRSNLYSRSV